MAPWFWTSSLQHCEKISICSVSYTVCGILLWNSEQTKTPMKTSDWSWRNYLYTYLISSTSMWTPWGQGTPAASPCIPRIQCTPWKLARAQQLLNWIKLNSHISSIIFEFSSNLATDYVTLTMFHSLVKAHLPGVNWLHKNIKSFYWGASLVAQWLRACLLMQGTRVQALVWEDPTCRGATKPVSHNYWACVSGACAPQQERPRWWEARAPRRRVAPARRNWRKPSHRNEDPTQPKINKLINLKKKKEFLLRVA